MSTSQPNPGIYATLQAPNPAKNATLTDGQTVVGLLQDAGISSNPRLYCNGTSPGGMSRVGLIPATTEQKSDDLPEWAQAILDGGTSLEILGIGADVPVFLQVWVPESGGGEGNFCDVADILRYTSEGLMTLKQAVMVS